MDRNVLLSKKEELLDRLIDDRIEVYGLRNAIDLLIDNDFTAEEIIDMGFDKPDVEEAFEENQ